MDQTLKAGFIASWTKYFNSAELPLTFYYIDAEDGSERVPVPSAHMCMIGVLARVRKGGSLCFDVDSIGCAGGKRISHPSCQLSRSSQAFGHHPKIGV